MIERKIEKRFVIAEPDWRGCDKCLHFNGEHGCDFPEIQIGERDGEIVCLSGEENITWEGE